MSELFEYLSTVLAVVGNVLNIKKMKAGFMVWLACNLISGILHYKAGMYGLVLRDVIFSVLAVVGYIKWSRKRS